MIRPILWFLARLPLLVLIFVVALVMSSCTMLGMNYASLETANKPAPSPALDVPAITIEGSPARETLKRKFEDVLYGPWPAGMPVSFGDWQMIDPEYLDGRGTLEEVEITIGSGEGARSFMLVTAFPKVSGPVPVVISQTFADTCSVFPDEPVTNADGEICDGSMMEGFPGWAATQIFGTYIALAPVERYFDAGLAYASFYASDFIPDRKKQAPEAMAALGGPVNPTSALMAWAYSFSAAVDVLDADPRIDPKAIGVMGHSRHGKSALIAAVWDRRIAAVVAHQSGFAGASLSRSQTGERLDRMAKEYPHWLAPEVQDWVDRLDEIPVDQHELLALVAPTPVLLGNGRRDVWSDPNSSFRAAEAASAAYEATGHAGLTATGMRDFDPAAGISWWLRPGGHSVVSEDIDAFTVFLHTHLVGEGPSQYAVH
ncbi:alpha/beta hydrolase family protein [Hyphomonas sp.]|uniref:alpha/beta hydrolase family protein n=1 Tax=Hyphomonas sp. TaxID=87 RepID=UPI00352831E1